LITHVPSTRSLRLRLCGLLTHRNRQWALVGEIPIQEMNLLEIEMLWVLKFALSISREDYDECLAALKVVDNDP
jgi:hypothetical protein